MSDGIYSAFTKLKVGLVSANSYAPIFEKKSYKVQFAEGQPEGVRIAGKFTIYSCHNFWWNYIFDFFFNFRHSSLLKDKITFQNLYKDF